MAGRNWSLGNDGGVDCLAQTVTVVETSALHRPLNDLVEYVFMQKFNAVHGDVCEDSSQCGGHL